MIVPLSIRRFLAMGLVLFATSQTASLWAEESPTPAPTCPTFGWAEGLLVNAGADAPFPVDDTAGNPDYHCPFHQWSWEAFVWAIGPDPTPRFLSLPTTAQLGTGNAAPPRVLQLKHRNRKSDDTDTAIGEVDQASGQALVDPHGQAVFYVTHMNQTYFDFANTYYGKSNYAKADPTTNFPVGSAVFKSSWRIVTDAAPAAGAFTTEAEVPYLQNSTTSSTGVEPVPNSSRTVTVALVGLHVVGVTENHPEFLWGTFEHDQNAPDLANPGDYDSSDPVSDQNFTFYQANTPAKASNLGIKVKVVDPSVQTLAPRTNVFRQYATGGESEAESANIAAINEQAQGSILSPVSSLNHAWANYQLIGTVWQEPNSLTPGDGTLEETAVGSIQLANSTMETFVQGPQNNGGKPANCFMCHNTVGNSRAGYPGKNINLSHALLGPFFED